MCSRFNSPISPEPAKHLGLSYQHADVAHVDENVYRPAKHLSLSYQHADVAHIDENVYQTDIENNLMKHVIGKQYFVLPVSGPLGRKVC